MTVSTLDWSKGLGSGRCPRKAAAEAFSDWTGAGEIGLRRERGALGGLSARCLGPVYPGEMEYPLDDRITALPLTRVADLDLRPES